MVRIPAGVLLVVNCVQRCFQCYCHAIKVLALQLPVALGRASVTLLILSEQSENVLQLHCVFELVCLNIGALR